MKKQNTETLLGLGAITVIGILGFAFGHWAGANSVTIPVCDICEPVKECVCSILQTVKANLTEINITAVIKQPPIEIPPIPGWEKIVV